LENAEPREQQTGGRGREGSISTQNLVAPFEEKKMVFKYTEKLGGSDPRIKKGGGRGIMGC